MIKRDNGYELSDGTMLTDAQVQEVQAHFFFLQGNQAQATVNQMYAQGHQAAQAMQAFEQQYYAQAAMLRCGKCGQ